MAVADAVAEAADPEELQVGVGAVDLFPEVGRPPNLAQFPRRQHFSLPAAQIVGTLSHARSHYVYAGSGHTVHFRNQPPYKTEYGTIGQVVSHLL